jgi:hypothetical protein
MKTRLGFLSILLLLQIARLGAVTYTPADGAEFQTYLDAVNCGDIISLTADGRKYSPANGLFYSFEVKDRGDCSANPIIIRTSNTAGLPAEGVRLNVTTHGSALAKVVGKAGAPVINVQGGARGYEFIGLDITAEPDNLDYYTADLVAVGINGTGTGGRTTLAERQSVGWITFDRSFFHPQQVSTTQLRSTVDYRTVGRGIALAGHDLTVKNSDFRGFGGFYHDDRLGSATITGATATSATFSNVSQLAVERIVEIQTTESVTGYSDQWRSVIVTGISGNVVTYKGEHSNTPPLTAGMTIVGNARWGRVIDAYAIYVPYTPTWDVLIENNYLEAHSINFFTGGTFGTDEFNEHSATLTAGATSTQATFSDVTGLSIGELVSFIVPAYTNPNNNLEGWTHKVAEVTNIAGLVVTYKGVGPTGLDEAPTTPGEAAWDGYNLEGLTFRNNTSMKISLSGGKKGHFELKSCIGCLIESNIFDGEWPSDVALTPHNQSGRAPWSQTSSTTFRYNWIKHGSRSFAVSINDPEATSVDGTDITVEHNLAVNYGQIFTYHSFYTNGGIGTNEFSHNTIIETTRQNAAVFHSLTPMDGFVFQDNIVYVGQYGPYNCQVPPTSYDACWPSGRVIDHNVLINDSIEQSNAVVAAKATGDFVVSTASDVGFVNFASGNYGLAPGSAYKNAGSDGTDIGVSCALLPVGACESAPVAETTRPHAPVRARFR